MAARTRCRADELSEVRDDRDRTSIDFVMGLRDVLRVRRDAAGARQVAGSVEVRPDIRHSCECRVRQPPAGQDVYEVERHLAG